uniref:hypothetical protein n=1 Tax=Pseudomonas sp. Larv2_ips TaxID=1896942 RepID=UPI001C49998B
KVEVPIEMANLLFDLDAKEFPILSSLSFDDYDMFSGSQLDSLADELLTAARLNPQVSKLVNPMLVLIYEAKSSMKDVLFNPFGR